MVIVCIATRGRPSSFARLMKSIDATREVAKVYVRIDNDDPLLDGYRALPMPFYAVRATGPRVDVAQAQQECLAAHPDEDCYAFIGDDTEIHTVGWDRKLRDAAGPWGISYPDDGLKSEAQATHPFIGGEFLRAIGFWALPGLSHLYTDTVWDFLGRHYGNLVYRPDVLVEHLHWSAGKSERDESYEKPTAARDQACFLNWSGQYRTDPALSAAIAAHATRTSGSFTTLALSP